MSRSVSEFITLLNQEKISAEQIPEEEIFRRVVGQARGAQNTIWMTMLLAAELASPLGGEYHEVIKDRLANGVQVTRVAFGTAEEFEAVRAKLGITSENYTFIHVPDVSQYQRMNLIDGAYLFFKIDDHYFRTENATVIKDAQNYIQEFIPES